MRKKFESIVIKNLEKIQELVVKAKDMLNKNESKVEIIHKIENASNLAKSLRRKILSTYIKTCFKNLHSVRNNKDAMQITKELLMVNQINH